LTSIQNMLPSIRSRRAEIEQARRLPRDLADELRSAGVFRMSVPRAIGGDEARPVDILRTVETVATADGSTGWCAMIGIGNNVSSGYMNEAGAKEVFADPAAPTCSPDEGWHRDQRSMAFCQRCDAL
jgi:alkylation response protein AidB-like acyl-CoA dehydrogenase